MSAPLFKRKHSKVFIKAEEVRKLVECSEDLMEIVEGVRCEPWQSLRTGSRLKDTPEWASFYVALKTVLRE